MRALYILPTVAAMSTGSVGRLTHSEMIAQGEASVAAYDKRIAEVEKELLTAPKARLPVIYQRLEQLNYDRTSTYNGVLHMKEDLRLHPELDDRPELSTEKEAVMGIKETKPARNMNINWKALLEDVDNGMSTKDAAKKYTCAEVTIINKLRTRRRKQREAVEAAAGAGDVTTKNSAEGDKANFSVVTLRPTPSEIRPLVNDLQLYVSSAARLTLETMDSFLQIISSDLNAMSAFDLGVRFGELHSDIGKADVIARSLLDMFPEP